MRYDYEENTFYVYIVTDQRKGTLYTGMTGNLPRRTFEHVHELVEGFSKDNHTDMLVYIEPQNDFESARLREKRIKEWPRAWKIRLIESQDPTWMDLSRRIGVPRRDGLHTDSPRPSSG